jgi:hypothetical protein
MASKRGLSVEEKKKRMLDFFFEKQDFFQLKDIEKLCSTEKGITLNTIKDILQSLVDDGLVDSEKIGTSIYYWSFPSKALKKRQEQIEKIKQGLVREGSKNEMLKEKFDQYQNSQDDEETRKQLESKYQNLMIESQNYLKQLESLKENDPQQYFKIKENVSICIKACNRWTENIFTLKSWLKNKYRFQEEAIDRQFEIPTDLDYI